LASFKLITDGNFVGDGTAINYSLEIINMVTTFKSRCCVKKFPIYGECFPAQF